MKLRHKAAVCTVFLLVLLIAVPSQAQYGDPATKSDGFDTALLVCQKSGLKVKEIKLQGWGRISKELYSLEQLERTYNLFSQGLCFAEEKPAIQREKDGFVGISRLFEKEGETWQLSLQAIPLPGQAGEGGTYLAFLYVGEDVRRARETYDILLELLSEAGFADKVGVTFTGAMAGLAPPAIKEALACELAGLVKADFVEGVVDDRFASLSFYTQECREHLVAGKKKVNLQIALCDEEAAATTLVHVGFPLIYQDY